MTNLHPVRAPTKLLAPQAQRIIDAAAEGKTLVAIAEELKLARATIWEHRRADPVFNDAVEHALIAGAKNRLDSLFEELDIYLRRPGASAAIAKVRWDILRSWLEKRFPAVFSPKQQIDVNVTVDLASSIERANKRAIANAQVIDLTPQAVTLATDTLSVAKPETDD